MRWYVDHLNLLLERLADFRTTASLVTGEIAPLNQLALSRTILQLQDLVGRMLITSDPYARTTWAMLALARFDDLGWAFELIADEDALQRLMQPLEHDVEIGPVFGLYLREVWSNVMNGLLDAAAGTLSADRRTITLVNGESMSRKRYVARYLNAVRDTIHRFHPGKVKDVFGLHALTASDARARHTRQAREVWRSADLFQPIS